MTVGIVMLVHTALDRAQQVARHWVAAGCPVVIHVDKEVSKDTYLEFVRSLADLPDVRFSKRHKCGWGTWGIVAGTQAASELILREFPDVSHVFLASGSCMPLRPVKELRRYLESKPRTDFIESATTADVPWTVGGLDHERFTLRFPFSWRKNRYLFDRYVALQRLVRFKRKIPQGIVPHMGSQWWCLTRQTLSAILQDPEREVFDRYFKRVWIPDESYFQTLARLYSTNIESRSLTLSKFDFQGKPHIFYDDHLQLLRRSDCFVARKIWPHATRLYDTFLNADPTVMKGAEPNPGKIDRIFAKAVDRRTRGRPGLYMQLTSSATLRDYHPQMFLTNLLWNTRGERQAFQFGPHDTQDISWMIAKDPNAHVAVVSGAWAVPLFQSNRNFADLREEAARLQRIENKHLDALRSPYAKARVKIWTMADFIDAPMEALQGIIDEMSDKTPQRLKEAPKMHNLDGFGRFLQNLKNQGMHPYLMGDFPVENAPQNRKPQARKPYLVR